MNIISVQQLSQYHGAHLVLDKITMDIKEGERIGLIGRNGSGKTTFMRLFAGLAKPDEGQLAMSRDIRVGYLAQAPDHLTECTILEVLSHGFKELNECRRKMMELEQRMNDPSCIEDAGQLERLLNRYASLQERFEREGGYGIQTSIDQVATGLDIRPDDYSLRFGSLSGGEQTRVLLASQLIVRPELLLLDEPTNHLDLLRTEWLESYLSSYPGTCVIISHDRYFLDRVVTRIIELEDGEANTAAGGYTDYMREKENRLLQQFSQYQEQQKKLSKMKETIKQLEEWGRNGDNEKFFKRAASMRRALERIEPLKRPVLERKEAAFGLRPQDRSGRRVAAFEQLEKAYGSRTVLKGASGLLQYGDKIVLIGRNGCGKTTLFKLLLGEEQPDTGQLELGARVEVGYLAQQEEPPAPGETVLAYFREQAMLEEGAARRILAAYLFYGADVFRSVGQLSGGEWTRLRLALLVQRQPNLLLLDEPTNHLDIASREALEEALEGFSGTVLAITHDRYLANRLAQRIWELQDGRLTVHIGDYDAYRSKKGETEAGELEPSRKAGALLIQQD